METLVKKNGSFPVVKTFFDDFFTKDLFDWTDKNFAALGSNIPSVNLKETDTKLEVELAAPGMKKEDFKIEIEDNVLKISSEKEEEHEENRKKDHYVRKEFSYSSFFRSFHLPDSADDSKVNATYKEGVLHVTINKKEGSKKKTSKRIDVK